MSVHDTISWNAESSSAPGMLIKSAGCMISALNQEKITEE